MSKRAADNPELPTAVKKARAKSVKSIEGVSGDDFKSTDEKLIKPELNQFVKTVAKMVNADWHDGTDEQIEVLAKYKERAGRCLQAVYNISVVAQKEFARCHEIVKIIADTWENMKSIPMRGSIEESFAEYCEVDIRVTDPAGLLIFSVRDGDEMIRKMWPRFLLAAAGCTNAYRVPDEVLARFVKDAADYGVDVLTVPENEGEGDDDEEGKEERAEDEDAENDKGKEERAEDEDAENDKGDDAVQRTKGVEPTGQILVTEPSVVSTVGLQRLTAIYNDSSLWTHLPSTRKVHKNKRAIDRRFSGPTHLRTRDSEGGRTGCVVC